MRKSLVGQVFGRLTVVCFSHKAKYSLNIWFCRCTCGKERLVYQGSLKSGATKSCGCLNKEIVNTHGKGCTPEYYSWAGLKQRCYNLSNKDYKLYGARGVTVCKRWKNSFENFYEDMGDRPEPKSDYSIERLDVNGNYCPENCKWATKSEQERNKRVRGEVKYYGVFKAGYSNKFRAVIGGSGGQTYLGTFNTELEAASAYDDAYEELHGIRRNGT